MLKNVATTVTVTAYDYSTGAYKTGDAANLTLYVSIDGATPTALTDTSATEQDSTHCPGQYSFSVTAAESNGAQLTFSGKSTTANVQIVPKSVTTIDLEKMGVADYGTSQAIGATTMTAQSGAPTCVTTDASSVGKTIRLTSGTNAGATAKVTSNVGSTKVLTFSGGWSNGATPSGTPTYILFDTAPDSAISTGLTTIAKLEAAFASSGVFSSAAMANVSTTELAAIAAQASNIQTRLPPALINGRIDSTGAWNVALSEGYAAVGDAPTPAQAVMLLLQMIAGKFAISGTQIDVYDLAGVSVVATYELDSATAPTSLTRTS